IEVLKSPYVTAARAKGLPERVVVLRHALRNALLPTITVLALDIGRLIGGIVVIETVFAYPGLGRLLVFSIQSRDIPTLQAAILVVATVYALANLAADLLYAWLNPRIRYGRSVARGAGASRSTPPLAPAAQGPPPHRRQHRHPCPAGSLDRPAPLGRCIHPLPPPASP